MLLLKNQQANKESKRLLENTETWKHNFPKSMGCRKAVQKRKFIKIKGNFKKQEKSQIKNLIYHLKELEKEEQANSKVSLMKEITKIREEIK